MIIPVKARDLKIGRTYCDHEKNVFTVVELMKIKPSLFTIGFSLLNRINGTVQYSTRSGNVEFYKIPIKFGR